MSHGGNWPPSRGRDCSPSAEKYVHIVLAMEAREGPIIQVTSVSHGGDWPPSRGYDGHLSSTKYCWRCCGNTIQHPVCIRQLWKKYEVNFHTRDFSSVFISVGDADTLCRVSWYQHQMDVPAMHVAIQPVTSMSSSVRTAGIVMVSGQDPFQMACSASNVEIDAGNRGQKVEERGAQPNDLVLGFMLDAVVRHGVVDVAKWRCKLSKNEVCSPTILCGDEWTRPPLTWRLSRSPHCLLPERIHGLQERSPDSKGPSFRSCLLVDVVHVHHHSPLPVPVRRF